MFWLVGCSMTNGPDTEQTNEPDTVQTTGLVSHWTFDTCVDLDSDRCTASEETGESYPAEIYGAVVIPGRRGGAISFDGINDFGNIAHSDIFDPPIKTYEFWFKKTNETIRPSPNGVDTEGLIYKAFDTGLNRAISVTLERVNAPFDLVLAVGVGSDSLAILYGRQIIQPKQWYHVVAYLGESEVVLYSNGQRVASQQLSAPPINNTAPIGIGMVPVYSTSLRFFNGLIDELRIYNRRLSDQEIALHYELGQ